MRLTRYPRELTAWTLYACVLFSLFACGIHHGQMSALSISGLQGGFCKTVANEPAPVPYEDTQRPGHMAPGSIDCPLCSFGHAGVPLNSSGWHLLLQAGGTSPDAWPWLNRKPPRAFLLAHSPRAPPLA
ncbi:DUF2946 domain-containing protein [Pseudomonas sp. LRF_L74]|uniref:DUF2946 domain-containing protein n=1 Tax=Pseudomonas sp. LRF_L74 TaxID=3369422 RepID=UPI003F645E43